MNRTRIAAAVALLLAIAGCGDDAPSGETTAPSTTVVASTAASTQPATTVAPTTAPPTTAEATTTTTYPWPTYEVPSTTRCVIGHLPDDALNVREGPSPDHGIVGTLSNDAAGFSTTGVAALDDQNREWVEITHEGQPAWVAGWLVTSNECSQAAPVDHCVVDTACTDRLNVRLGPGANENKIGSLAHDEVDVAGTGWTTTDESDRTWTQIQWGAGVAWVAGWFLTDEPCTPWPGQPCSCPADGSYPVLIHAVDVPGRMLDYDVVNWVWTGPADTEGYWENPDQTVLHLPIANGTDVMACPSSDLLYCEPPAHVAYSLSDLAQWITNGTEVGQNQRFMGEIPGHTGQLWLIELSGCSIVDISGRWVP